MFLRILTLLFSGLCICSGKPSKPSPESAILSDQRYLSVDGQFGSAVVQEDGAAFSEEADINGNRRGTYSYIGNDGRKISVSYTAGKDGFRAVGDHIPVPLIAPPIPVSANNDQNTYDDGFYHESDTQNDQKSYDDGSYRGSDTKKDPKSLDDGSYHTPELVNTDQKSHNDGSYHVPKTSNTEQSSYSDSSRHNTLATKIIHQKSNNRVSYHPAPLSSTTLPLGAYYQQSNEIAQKQNIAHHQSQIGFNQNILVHNQGKSVLGDAFNPFPTNIAIQTSTTEIPARIFPPGRLNLNQNPQGFSYTFQTVL